MNSLAYVFLSHAALVEGASVDGGNGNWVARWCDDPGAAGLDLVRGHPARLVVSDYFVYGVIGKHDHVKCLLDGCGAGDGCDGAVVALAIPFAFRR